MYVFVYLCKCVCVCRHAHVSAYFLMLTLMPAVKAQNPLPAHIPTTRLHLTYISQEYSHLQEFTSTQKCSDTFSYFSKRMGEAYQWDGLTVGAPGRFFIPEKNNCREERGGQKPGCWCRRSGEEGLCAAFVIRHKGPASEHGPPMAVWDYAEIPNCRT